MQLNKIFSSHMVFAKGLPIRVYGEGEGVAKITFAGKEKTVVANGDNWLIEFEPMEYGGPYVLEAVFEDSKVVLDDIYVGEVYLFAGQSNMQFKLGASTTPESEYESNDMLRLFSPDRIEKTDHYVASDGWVTCQKDFAEKWSALAYLAGNEIAKTKNVAIGIIVCYQGASIIESWVPEGILDEISKANNVQHPDHTYTMNGEWNTHGTLYSKVLSQAIPYSLTSAVWYQGESDANLGESKVYADELCILIDTWRKDFMREDLPFVIVQIADYNNARDGQAWKNIQKAQIDVLSMRDNLKGVISRDVCENDDIHPKTKAKLAHRIAAVLCE